MNKLFVAILGLLLVGGLAVLFFKSPSTSDTQGNQPVKWADIETQLSKGAKLYDVRTPAEYAAGHAPGAINLDSEEVTKGKSPEVEKTTKLYLYCRTGHRAGLVKSALESRGFSDVTSLGGLTDIEAKGATLTK